MSEPIPLGARARRRRRRLAPPRDLRSDLLRTSIVTTIVTVGVAGFLGLTVHSFDADEIKELGAVVAFLGPTVLGLLRYLNKES